MQSKKLVTIGLPMIAVTYGLSRFSYGLMLPYINEEMNMDPSASGLISSLSYLAYCLAILLAMVFSNKVTPKSILMAAGLTSVIGLGVIASSSSPIILSLGIFLAGLSTGWSSPPYANIVDTNIEVKLQNQTNSWINSGTSIGTAFTGMIVIFMGNNWRETYMIFLVIAVFVLITNYKGLPKNQDMKKKRKASFSKKEGKQSIQLIVASLLLGVSCSAYWTFSRDFILNLENTPAYLGEWLWVIIGIAGLMGGTAGVFINKFGLMAAYRISVLALSTSSLILGILPGHKLMSIISPTLFGGSYIFMTGVLIVWGVSIFKNSPSFGLGVPFLLLAFGQAAGSVLSGMIADSAGYHDLFIGASVIGYITLVFRHDAN